MDTKKRLLEELEKIDVAQLTSEMIKIQSYSFMEQQEREIAHYIDDYFKAQGIDSKVIEIEEGRYNVVAKLPGKNPEKARSLQLSGHMDTVPAYDFEDAFSGRIEDGKVFGRGACDMKGPLAAMMAAMTAIKRAGIELEGDLYFTGVADEEELGKGVKYLIKHGPHTTGAIVGEPGEMIIQLGHKGLEWIEVHIEGKKVHGGDYKNGINAIQMASRFVTKICDEYVPVLESREHPILGVPTINVGTIQGGDQPSTVPGDCYMKLDRRCVPEETIEQVYAELEEIAAELHEEDPRFKATIRDVFEGANDMPHLPFATDPSDPLVTSVKEALCAESEARHGEVLEEKDIPLSVFPAWTDAGFMTAETDMTCIVLGPGQLGVAHSVHEFVDIEQLEKAAYVYAAAAINYCKMY